ncbi:hypothetical protein SDC9_134311 [bioreactor metagenome]|uniref:Uncharacterized protein n=1 Tax=bioreactor metagenome TaxID=1076179 RepID=A0A645DDA5_9ZZZZ
MANRLRPAVHGKMFCAGACCHHIVLTLHTVDKRLAELCGQIGVFAECFVSSAPARVTEDIDVRGKEGKPFINVPIIVLGEFVVLCAPFQRGCAAHGR